MIEFRHVREHIEVYQDEKFVLSADTAKEASEEMWKQFCEEYDGNNPIDDVVRKEG